MDAREVIFRILQRRSIHTVSYTHLDVYKRQILENESEACEGAEIDSMSDEELKDFVEGISVYARVSPEHKIRIVRAWQ